MGGNFPIEKFRDSQGAHQAHPSSENFSENQVDDILQQRAWLRFIQAGTVQRCNGMKHGFSRGMFFHINIYILYPKTHNVSKVDFI